MISEDAYFFLQAFFQTHPEYAKNPLYIVGESYAGVSLPCNFQFFPKADNY